MPRYVFNTVTGKIHSADCPKVGRTPVPWPRFGKLSTNACRHCLPEGRPFVPRTEVAK